MVRSSVAFFALLLISVLAISEITIVKGKVCEKPSKTWFGTCKDTNKCDKQCIEWEGAKHGACHQRESKFMCFCYVDCPPKDKSPSPPGAGEPPPGTGIPSPPLGPPPPEASQPPPPSDGGSPPPPAEGGQPPPSQHSWYHF